MLKIVGVGVEIVGVHTKIVRAKIVGVCVEIVGVLKLWVCPGPDPWTCRSTAPVIVFAKAKKKRES